MRIFPLSDWTELDVWEYIAAENIPVVPLYFAAQRPVVERNGTWIMVDDERLPLGSDETPQMRQIRFRTLGCYPLSGGIELNATSVEDIIAELRSSQFFRAPGPTDRSRRERFDGTQEAGRIFLMHGSTPSPGAQRSLLRFLHGRLGRRRQVNVDRQTAA